MTGAIIITLNIKKCEYIHFSYRKVLNFPFSLTLGDVTLNRVKQYKYLGTVIDEKLNGEAQYNHISQLLALRKQTFSKIRFLMDTETAVLLYKSTIQPLFDYNDFFYNMLDQGKQNKLQSIQNRFLRIVYRNMNMTTEEMFVHMDIGKLRVRQRLHLCGQMYKRAQKNEYVDNRDLPTRQFDKIVLRVPDVLLTKSFQTPIYKGAHLWNALPREVQISPTYKEFKYRYKRLDYDRLL